MPACSHVRKMKSDHLRCPDSMRSAGKGQVLRVKYGLNANSGAIGSFVFALPAAVFVSAAVVTGISALLYSALLDKVNKGGP